MPFPDPSLDSDLARLTDRALTAAAKSTLADIHSAATAMEQRGQALLAIHAALQHELNCLTPPPEFVAALRRPCGAPCLVRLAIYGRRARVVVHPIGIPSPIREAAAWQSLTAYFRDRGMAA